MNYVTENLFKKLQRTLLDKRTINVIALVGAYGVGQGSIFIAQTYLLSKGQAAFLGVFGITFLIFSLAVQTLDWGGQILLARAYLMSGLSEAKSVLSQVFVIRAIIASVFAIVYACLSYFHVSFICGFSGDFYLSSCIALAIMIFNPAGILDGMQRAGFNGIATALPFIGTSLCLMMIPESRLIKSGTFLGASYATGAFLGLLAQYTALAVFTGEGFQLMRELRPCVKSATIPLFLDGAANIAATMPGQFFFRGQVAAVSSLGMAAVGAFIYVKQILTSAAQFSAFMRRAEIAQYTKNTSRIRFAQLLYYPSFAIALASVLALSAVIALVNILHIHMSKDIRTIDICFVWLAPTIITSAVASLLSQWVQLRLTIKASALIMISTSLTGIVFLFAIPRLGIVGAAVCEFAVHIAQIFLLYEFIRRRFSNNEIGL
jgi:hypothetical protein